MKISELTVSRECPRKAIDQALHCLLQMHPMRSGNFVQVHMTPKGTVSQRVTTGAACHANLGSTFATTSPREVVGFCHTSGRKEHDHIKTFYDWFIHRSFASGFVVAENERGFVVDADIPPELLQNIGIISRHGWELSQAPFAMFDYIVSKGYREETAYVCAFNSGLNPVSGETCVDTLLKQAVGDAMGGHRAWRLFSLGAFQNFLNGDFGEKLAEFVKKPSARTRATITGGLSLCDAGPNLNQYKIPIPIPFTKELMTEEGYKDFRNLLSDFRVQGGEMYRPPNPFVRGTTKIPTGMMSFNELIEVALPYLKTKGFPV